MAGRPKTMVSRVEQFEVAAFQLADAILQAMPEEYRNGADGDGIIGGTWREVLADAVRLWGSTNDLGDMLRENTGLSTDGPTDHCRLVRRQRPNVTVPNLDLLNDEAEIQSAGADGI